MNRVFIGTCTNSRLDDLRAAAAVVKGRRAVVPAWVVPGSGLVKRAAEAEGLDRVFVDAGFEWREAGCSMCVGMNGDTSGAGERVASTSNRNFEGRQGKGARTHLMSPAMAAAAAVTGRLTDVRALRGLAMQPFTRVTATAVPIDLPNVDTDRVIPARFLRKDRNVRSTRASLPRRALRRRRRGAARVRPEPGPVSRREDRGRRRELRLRLLARGGGVGAGGVRRPLGDRAEPGRHLHQNCFKNGLLPVILDGDAVAALRRQLHAAPGSAITVDLEAQTVTAPDGACHRFDVDAFRREMLLGGRDEIELTLGFEAQIREFEAHHAREMAWAIPPRPGG